MQISELQLKLEEVGVPPEKIDEILLSVKNTGNDIMTENGVSGESLEIRREFETDWRKKVIIAAEIIKRGLST